MTPLPNDLSARRYRQLVERYGLGRLEKIERFAVLTATPDLVSQGLMGELLRELERHGAFPVAALPHHFSAAESLLLYGGRTTHMRNNESRFYSQILGPQLYTNGISVVLVLRECHGEQPLQSRVRDLKGGSRIGEHEPGQLRSLSPLTDRSFSLLHCPDDYDGFFHELELVFGVVGTCSAIADERTKISIQVVEELAPADTLRNAPHPFDILLRLCEQAMCLVLCDPRSPVPNEFINQALLIVTDERRKLAQRPIDAILSQMAWGALERMQTWLEQALRFESQSWHGFSDLLMLHSTNARIELFRSLMIMCKRETFDLLVVTTLGDALRRCGLPLSDMDYHRLQTIAAYHGRNVMSNGDDDVCGYIN